MKSCQKCGFSNADNAKFCKNCGREFKESFNNMKCKQCGQPIVPGSKFCKHCGAMIDYVKESVPEIKKEEPKGSSTKKNTGIIALIAIGIVVIIAIIVVMGKKPSNDDYTYDNQTYEDDDNQDYSSTEIPVDVYEPNDSIASAVYAQVGHTYKGVLNSVDDKDYFCVEANGYDSISYVFTRETSNTIDGIGWEVSYNTTHNSKASSMAWTNDSELTNELSDIEISDGYFIVWIENTRNDPDTEEVMEFVSSTEYSITFYYNDYEDDYDDNEFQEYILEDSGTRYLTKTDLMGLSEEECRLARNEIYARHGRMFKDESLQDYFEAFDWYYPSIQPGDFEESMLNEYEIYNRDLIVEYEEEMGYR